MDNKENTFPAAREVNYESTCKNIVSLLSIMLYTLAIVSSIDRSPKRIATTIYSWIPIVIIFNLSFLYLSPKHHTSPVHSLVSVETGNTGAPSCRRLVASLPHFHPVNARQALRLRPPGRSAAAAELWLAIPQVTVRLLAHIASREAGSGSTLADAVLAAGDRARRRNPARPPRLASTAAQRRPCPRRQPSIAPPTVRNGSRTPCRLAAVALRPSCPSGHAGDRFWRSRLSRLRQFRLAHAPTPHSAARRRGLLRLPCP